VHRQALTGGAPTAMTRAFTGRLARGIRNRFLDRHGAAAPAAYPELHHLTAPCARPDGPQATRGW
jgi:nitronate monooxygenase